VAVLLLDVPAGDVGLVVVLAPRLFAAVHRDEHIALHALERFGVVALVELDVADDLRDVGLFGLRGSLESSSPSALPSRCGASGAAAPYRPG
jgi:hypothetical protein